MNREDVAEIIARRMVSAMFSPRAHLKPNERQLFDEYEELCRRMETRGLRVGASTGNASSFFVSRPF